MDRDFGKFSKAAQVGERMQTKAEADRQFKVAVACVWLEWLRLNYPSMACSLNIMPPMDCLGKGRALKELELDHIRNKTHGDRYDLLNVQLITPEKHREKTDSGEYTDYRPAEFVAWLKALLR